MKIYLIRHGVTDANKCKSLQGRTDISLNEQGRELARITSEGLKDINFDIIFTSPLKRARETAEIIRGNRDIPVIDCEDIQEISFGEYEGLCFGKENYTIPDKDFMFFFEKPECYKPAPGGETFEEVLERTGRFMQKLIQTEEYQDKTILLSTHGCALKALLANVQKLPVAQFWGEGVHKNCAVSLVEVKNGCPVVVEDGKIYY